MSGFRPSLFALLVLLVALHLTPLAIGEESAPIDFNREIRPILNRYCLSCHGPDEEGRKAGLRLDRRNDAIASAIVPFDREGSELFRRLRTEEVGERMPPVRSGHELEDDEIRTLGDWIDQGAPYAEHWAFVAPVSPPVPTSPSGWAQDDLDRFVEKALRERGLSPSEEADDLALIRRVHLDLLGLPPSLQDVRRFLDDPCPDAYDALVRRLLKSPRYGEHWARVWLDLARYADSSGYGSDPLRSIWRYRDWVIEALNQNMPFDQFTIEQIAGDLLPDPTPNQLLATAFHRNTMTNTEGGTDDEEFRVAAVKDRVNTTFQTWMGLTVGCAQCHNHKYDPITQQEYYQLFALFNQTEDTDQPDDRPRARTPTREQQRELDGFEERIRALEASLLSPPSEVVEAFPRWVWETRRGADWDVVRPHRLESDNETSLHLLDDSSILATGPPSDRDVYTCEFRVDGGVTALKLEVLPHDSLPNRGPGRSAGNGNFVLSEVEVDVFPAEGSRETPTARYVRVDLPGDGRILSLAEVEVWVDGHNIAPSGQAKQSSEAFAGPPRLAIDGVTDGAYQNGSVTHTAQESSPWWELDLQKEVDVEKIVVWNRKEVPGRLAGFVVTLEDANRETVFETPVRRPPSPNLEITPTLWFTPLAVEVATADFSQEGWSIERAVDADPKTGWAIAPQIGRPHHAIFSLSEKNRPASDLLLRLRLHQGYGSAHTLGRFRLSVTDRQEAPRVAPKNIRALLSRSNLDEEGEATLLTYYASITETLAPVHEEIESLRSAITNLDVPTTPVMRELPPERRRETHVMIKGNFLQRGEKVEPQTPSCFPPLPEGPKNRLALAKWLVHRDNPLTARVMVNRLWARLFGIGLVETEEDFGTQGLQPSHPELLDFLAIAFMESGWDIKALLHRIVTSATYRQGSRITDEHYANDPRNRYLSRGSRFRLDAETLRDQALSLAGLLSDKMFGPSVHPFQPKGLWQAAFNGQRTWPTSQGEDRHRRGVYTFLRRTVPYPSMATFDAPSRELCTLRRIRTNTPLQAFVTLNDPVFVEAAQGLARRVVKEGGPEDQDRVSYALKLCLLRDPTPQECAPLLSLLRSERLHFGDRREEALAIATNPIGPLEEGQDPTELAAWTVIANVLLNLDRLMTKG